MPVSPAVTPPPGSPRFPGVDGLRAVAILMVIFCHTLLAAGLPRGDWSWVGLYLSTGVVLFFAISGFLIYRPFVAAHARGDRGPELGRFARRRILRILPAYWVALTLLAIWPGAPGAFTGDWWIYYFFLQGYGDDTIIKGLGITWSLCAEVAFYALLPLYAWGVLRLARMLRCRWWRAEAVALVAFAALGTAMHVLALKQILPAWSGNALLTTSIWFAGGMSMAVLSVAAERAGSRAQRVRAALARRGGLLWLGALVAFLLGARILWIAGVDTPANAAGQLGRFELMGALQRILFGLAAVLVLAPVVAGAGGVVRRVSTFRPLMLLGLVSYGVFLWHYLIVLWLHGGNPQLAGGGPGLADDFVLLTLATLAISIAVATLSYRVVELPFLRRKEPAAPAVALKPAPS